jgi:hypothetical protein
MKPNGYQKFQIIGGEITTHGNSFPTYEEAEESIPKPLKGMSGVVTYVILPIYCIYDGMETAVLPSDHLKT